MLQRATAAEIKEPHFSNPKAESTPGFETKNTVRRMDTAGQNSLRKTRTQWQDVTRTLNSSCLDECDPQPNLFETNKISH